MHTHKKLLTQNEHYDNAEVSRCSNCNIMSFPDSDILADLMGEPEWDDKDKDMGSYSIWAGVFMSIQMYDRDTSKVYSAGVSFQYSEDGRFWGEKEYADLDVAKEACIKATKEKYRLMLEVDKEKQQALHMATRAMSIPEHLKDS